MARKTGTWLIVSGAIIAFFGLCTLLGSFEPNQDKVLLGAGMAILSTGMTLVAGGLYLKARAVSGTAARASASPSKRGRKGNCDRCGKNEPVIQCRVHQVHLCGGCLGEHYDFRACAYVPSTRRSTPRAAAYTHASGA
jgi:hypothetical protein